MDGYKDWEKDKQEMTGFTGKETRERLNKQKKIRGLFVTK